MVVGFITTCAINAYHLLRRQFEPPAWRDELDTIQHYVIEFVSDLRHVGGFLRVLPVSANKTDRHDMVILVPWR